MDAYERLTKEEKRNGPPPPKSERTLLNDTTIEAVEEALAGSPAGLMVCHDELAGWFGSMERYASGRGGSDRPFWLEAYNGGRRASNRITRGNKIIPNLSVCILGGIQPDKIREIAREAADDGLLQRLLTIILRPGTIARDEPQGNEAKRYKALIRKLFEMRRRPTSALDGIVQKRLRFDDAAQQVMYRVQKATHKLGPIKQVNSKVASAFLKAEGTFARLCVLFHCIEHAFDHDLPFEISLDTAERVERFLTEFVQPHQLAFFAGTLGLSDDQDALTTDRGPHSGSGPDRGDQPRGRAGHRVAGQARRLEHPQTVRAAVRARLADPRRAAAKERPRNMDRQSGRPHAVRGADESRVSPSRGRSSGIHEAAQP